MKKNRKITKKKSVIVTHVFYGGELVLALGMVVLVYILAASSCSQLMKSIGQNERELAKLEESYQRESSRWEGMKTPEKVEAALLKHGLEMKLPRAAQIVHMRKDGTPRPGQWSVTKAQQRRLPVASKTTARRRVN